MLLKKLNQRWLVLLFLGLLLFVIPMDVALAQNPDPEATRQENNDLRLVVSAIIVIVSMYVAVLVGEDADSRGKDGFQFGVFFFVLVCPAPIAYIFLGSGDIVDRLYAGGGEFAVALIVCLFGYYLGLRPKQHRFI